MVDFTLMELAGFDDNSVETKKRLDKLFYRINTMLGGSGIPVHLEDIDYTTAFERAVNVYRTVSQRSVYESYATMTLAPSQNVYVLNEQVDNVMKIYRTRGVFSSSIGSFESFGAATANILLQGAAGANGAAINLASYDFLLQYDELLERLFAREIHFKYRNDNNTIYLTQLPRYSEVVLLRVSVLKTIEELLNDHWAYDWLYKYTMAVCKGILGEKYSLFATSPGAQGGTTLKGDALKNAGAEETKTLEADALLYSDSGEIPMPVRG